MKEEGGKFGDLLRPCREKAIAAVAGWMGVSEEVGHESPELRLALRQMNGVEARA